MKLTFKSRWWILPLLLTALPFLMDGSFFPFVLVRSGALYFLWGYLILAALLWWFRRPHLAVVSAALFLGLFLVYLPYYLPKDRVHTFENGLVVGHYNVLKFNKKYDRTVQSALATQADFLSFQEVDQQWVDTLKSGLEQVYPYAFFEPQEDCYGSCVFSKTPLYNLETHWWEGKPVLTGDVDFERERVHFLTAHTRSPIRPSNVAQRNLQLLKIGEYVAQRQGPTLAIGDFNVVPWDPSWQRMVERGNLRESRVELDGTYPSWRLPVKLPIDFILHTDHLVCGDFKTLHDTSSDHLGILGVYQFNQ